LLCRVWNVNPSLYIFPHGFQVIPRTMFIWAIISHLSHYYDILSSQMLGVSFWTFILLCWSVCPCAFLNFWVCNRFQNWGGLVLPYRSSFQSFLDFSHFFKKYINFRISLFGLTKGMCVYLSVCICINMYIWHIKQKHMYMLLYWDKVNL